MARVRQEPFGCHRRDLLFTRLQSLSVSRSTSHLLHLLKEDLSMHRVLGCLILALSVCFISSNSVAQSTTPTTATATCNFDPNTQLAVEYRQIEVNPKKKALGNEIPYGKVWAPGDKPMELFTNTPLTLGGKEIPLGAYTMFIIPEQKTWTLVISKSTDTSGKYDEREDFARIPMQFGKLLEAEPEFTVYFAHVAADECNMRLDLQQARAWVAFKKQ